MSGTIIGIVLIVAFAGLAWLLLCKTNILQEKIYIYPKTKDRYLVKGIVKMKDPLSLKWINAVLYISFKDGNYYVREEEQFFDRFITLKEWKEQNGNVKNM